MTYESSLTMRIAISRSAANVNSWDCHALPSITSPFQCGNPRCGSWRELMPFSWKIPAAGADEWWTTWPEKASRSAGIAYETSCAAWVYVRSTRNHAPRSQVNHYSTFCAWWSSMKSKQWTRSGLLILLTFRCAKASSIWWLWLISSPGTYSVGSSRTALTRSSVWMPWRWPSQVAASRRSCTPIRAANSPQGSLYPGCRLKGSRSAGLEESGVLTTSWWSGYGGRSNMRRCICGLTAMAGKLRSVCLDSSGGMAM